MVFYRKYRPQTLKEFDNKQVRMQLSRFLSKEQVAHAFLFTGPKGTGKTSAARIIAKSINCTGKKGDACGMCDTCVSIARGESLDVIEIDAASNRGIDEIRSLRESIKLTPLSLDYKVYIIDEVHMLTTEAFNALLKTLEEPPAHAVFILATTEPHKLLATIISRCIHITFSKATVDDIVESLKRITKGEKLKIADDILRLIAAESDGSFRDAAKLLEQAVLSEKKVTAESIAVLIGKSDKGVLDDFLVSLQKKNMQRAIAVVQTLVDTDKSIRVFVKSVLETLEQKLVDAVLEEEKQKNHLVKKSAAAKASKDREEKWTIAELHKALSIFSSNWGQYKSALIPQLPLELAIVDYCSDDYTKTVSPKKTEGPIGVSKGLEKNIDSTYTADASVQPVLDQWQTILEGLKQYNHSIVGVLRSCKPLSFREHVLKIESPYKFHMERLTEPKVQTVVAQVISDALGETITVKVVMKNNND